MDPGLRVIATSAKLTLLDTSGNDAKPRNHMRSYAPLAPLVVVPSLVPWWMAPKCVTIGANDDGAKPWVQILKSN